MGSLGATLGLLGVIQVDFSDVVRRGAGSARSDVATPSPIANVWHIVSVASDIILVIVQFVANCLLRVRCPLGKHRNSVDHRVDQRKAIHEVENDHVEGRSCCAFFNVASNVQILMRMSPERQAMNQPRVTMERKDDRLIDREKRVELGVRQSVRMLLWRLKRHQVDYVDDSYPKARDMSTKQLYGSDSL